MNISNCRFSPICKSLALKVLYVTSASLLFPKAEFMLFFRYCSIYVETMTSKAIDCFLSRLLILVNWLILSMFIRWVEFLLPFWCEAVTSWPNTLSMFWAYLGCISWQPLSCHTFYSHMYLGFFVIKLCFNHRFIRKNITVINHLHTIHYWCNDQLSLYVIPVWRFGIIRWYFLIWKTVDHHIKPQ